jgi:histone deacetylase 11
VERLAHSAFDVRRSTFDPVGLAPLDPPYDVRYARPDAMRIVYSPKYDLPAHYLGRGLHPFDLKKYSRAYRLLGEWLGPRLGEMTVAPPREISRDELLWVHTAEYLERLRTPAYLAAAVEVPLVAKLPAWLTDRLVLRSMRWGTMGTVVAAREALSAGVAVNLSGGYHHAKPDGAEGFCFYADIAIAVAALRRVGRLADGDRVAYVDLDAHQGNGVSHSFMHDARLFLFDAYNADIYPCYDRAAIERIDCKVPLESGCGDGDYLGKLRDRLPGFLDSILRGERVALAIYNAGTDVYAGDALGGLNVSAEGVLERDVYVVEQLRQRGMPVVMLLSGGYSDASHRLVANSVSQLVERFG